MNHQVSQPLQAYYSHSYRAEDRAINRFFWQLFSEHGFFLTIDPKSERTFVPHLERMIRLSDCFIAIITKRLETKRKIGSVLLPQPQSILTYSPYVEFENRLSVRSGKPRLVFIEAGLDSNLFGKPDDVYVFERDTVSKQEEHCRQLVRKFSVKVLEYKKYAEHTPRLTRKAGILLNV